MSLRFSYVAARIFGPVMRLRFDDFVLDLEARQLLRGSEEVHVRPKTYELLELLISSRPRALSKVQIRRHLWPETAVEDVDLTVLVTDLRSILGDDAKAPRYVRTVRRFGYAFCGEATEEGPAPAAKGVPRVLWERKVVPLLEGENVLGRDEGVGVRIDEQGVSRRHARIVVANGSATLEDLGSKNGTSIGEDELAVTAPVPLLDNTPFRLGRILLLFRSAPETRTTATDRPG
jgi:DNA-binding winged helix-turn-helix (wHTH) protein